ncbi:hypothetical protein Smp_020880 [Schistosoma mansoni]|uniref:hypothetical protein n=1 Tax=Schistosoma mansoni TaxID=6183 RepID=UPI0001A635AD|nr:hypothetical protein Smp_020880 [Schistosoma mansoni]|eukprot:XP_018654063.1 hypothetical protein Smp_020880 [Schistosoma mansoni]
MPSAMQIEFQALSNAVVQFCLYSCINLYAPLSSVSYALKKAVVDKELTFRKQQYQTYTHLSKMDME